MMWDDRIVVKLLVDSRNHRPEQENGVFLEAWVTLGRMELL